MNRTKWQKVVTLSTRHSQWFFFLHEKLDTRTHTHARAVMEVNYYDEWTWTHEIVFCYSYVTLMSINNQFKVSWRNPGVSFVISNLKLKQETRKTQ